MIEELHICPNCKAKTLEIVFDSGKSSIVAFCINPCLQEDSNPCVYRSETFL